MLGYWFFALLLLTAQVTKTSSWLAPHRFFSADRDKEMILTFGASPSWGYWDNQGYQNLPEGHIYAVASAMALGRLQLGDIPLGVRGGGRWAYAWSENPNDRRTHSNIDPLFAGLDWSFVHNTGYWQVSWDELRPSYRNDLSQDVVAIGDGVDSSQFALQWLSPRRSWHIHMGYHVKQNLASLWYSQVRLNHKNFFLGLESWQTIQPESSNTNPRATWTCTVNGCSPWAMAYNPTRWTVIAGFQGDVFGAELQQVVWGQNVALDTTLWLVWRWPTTSPKNPQWKQLPAKPDLFEERIDRQEPIPVTPVPVIDPLQKKNINSPSEVNKPPPAKFKSNNRDSPPDEMNIRLIKKKKKP